MIVYSPWKSIFPLGAMKKCPFQSIETSVRFMNKAFPAISYAWLHLMSPCQENSICYRAYFCCCCYIQLYLTNSANKTFFTKPFRIPRRQRVCVEKNQTVVFFILSFWFYFRVLEQEIQRAAVNIFFSDSTISVNFSMNFCFAYVKTKNIMGRQKSAIHF